tara:strand:- start:2191 stop:2904 length:714 start_codon:yes stop_codon:yes gene_type:complete
MYNIYIPSYNRPDNVKTFDYLGTGKIVVPESQKKDYQKKYGEHVLSIDDSLDGNIVKKRNAIINLIKKKEKTKCAWIIDDDLVYIKRKKENKKLKGDVALELMEKTSILFNDMKVGLAGFDYTEDNLKNKDFCPISLNKPFYQIILINTSDNIIYDKKLKVAEDLDIWLQKIIHYRRTLKLNQYCATFYGDEGGEHSVIGWTNDDRIEASKIINKKYGYKVMEYKKRWNIKIPIKGV